MELSAASEPAARGRESIDRVSAMPARVDFALFENEAMNVIETRLHWGRRLGRRNLRTICTVVTMVLLVAGCDSGSSAPAAPSPSSLISSVSATTSFPPTSSSAAPAGSALARLREFGLETLPGPVPTYFSAGFQERAEDLQDRLRHADSYYGDRLDIHPEFHLAILDSQAWAELLPHLPYGVAFVTDPPHVVVLPAIPGRALVTQIFRESEPDLPPSAAKTLAAADLEYEEAIVRVIDLFGFHEIGHVYLAELGFREGSTARWLEEILATYAAYSFLASTEPESIDLWDALSEGVIDHVVPTTKDLDDFSRIYLGLDQETYGWFQTQFNLRVSSIVEIHPDLTWFDELISAGLTENTRAMTSAELLQELEASVPGTTAWAVDLGMSPQR